ncbi:MAG: hypothetical protein ACI8TA_003291 [Cyclobacteriaceae bacterium]|jgi:hypothetical protein
MKILFTTILTFAYQAQEIVWDSTFVVDQIEFKVLACKDDKGSFAQLVKSKTDTLPIDGVSGNI